MFPVVIGSNYYDSWIYQGGAFQLGFNLFWVHLMGEPRAARTSTSCTATCRFRPADGRAGQRRRRIYQTWLAHPTFDDYWKALAVNRRYAQVTSRRTTSAAGTTSSSRGTLENFLGMRAEGGSEARGGDSACSSVRGPTAAPTAPYPDHSFAEFGGLDAVDLDAVQLRYFAFHLRGDRNGLDDEPPVRLFVMGENRWRDEDDWPPAASRPNAGISAPAGC